MSSAALGRHKWPKVHDHLVEELIDAGLCLTVAEALRELPPAERASRSTWALPSGVTLVARTQGCTVIGRPFRFWYLRCPRCLRCRAALYRLPGRDRWLCRGPLCLDLIYASQRWHSLRPWQRRVMTPRAVLGRRRAMREEERRRDVAARRAVKQAARPHPTMATPPVDFAELRARDEMDRAILRRLAAGDRLEVVVDRRTGALLRAGFVRRGDEDGTAAVGAQLMAEAGRTVARLQQLAETAPSARIRAGARRRLAQLGERPAAPPARQATTPRTRPPAAVGLTAEDFEAMRRVEAEDMSDSDA